MICQLCKTEKRLIRRSHIIPDFMYNGLFNEKHFIADFDLTGKRDTRLYPNGFYDSNILCKECDNILIGRLESYAKVVLFGGKGKRSDYHEIAQEIDIFGNKILHVKNIDYKRFKLFLLSVLWRASISKQEIFRHVNLGCHEDIIRKMIYDSNPGNESEYPMSILLFTPNDICPTEFITNPFPVGNDENISYIFTINSMIINYKIFGGKDMEIYNRLMIRKSNSMEIIIMNAKSSVDYLDTYMQSNFRYKNSL
jgi:hypothetical protein